MRLFLTLPSGSHISQLVLLSLSLYFVCFYDDICCVVLWLLAYTFYSQIQCAFLLGKAVILILPPSYFLQCVCYTAGIYFPNLLNYFNNTLYQLEQRKAFSPNTQAVVIFVRDDAFFLVLGFMHCFSSRRPFHVKMPKAKVQGYPELGPRLNFQCLKTHTQHTVRPQVSFWDLRMSSVSLFPMMPLREPMNISLCKLPLPASPDLQPACQTSS